MSIGYRISKDSDGRWDAVLDESGKFTRAVDAIQSASHAVTRVLIFKGEYSLNGKLTGKDDLGTEYYEVVFRADATEAEKQLAIKSRILETPGVVRFLSFGWEKSDSTIDVTGDVLTEWGVVPLTLSAPTETL